MQVKKREGRCDKTRIAGPSQVFTPTAKGSCETSGTPTMGNDIASKLRFSDAVAFANCFALEDIDGLMRELMESWLSRRCPDEV